jgi:hypothetical protein
VNRIVSTAWWLRGLVSVETMLFDKEHTAPGRRVQNPYEGLVVGCSLGKP